MSFIWKALISYIEKNPDKIHLLLDLGLAKLVEWLTHKSDPTPVV